MRCGEEKVSEVLFFGREKGKGKVDQFDLGSSRTDFCRNVLKK